MLCLVWIAFAPDMSAAEPAQPATTATPPTRSDLAETNSGPQALKQKVRIVVDTNAPPAAGATNAATADESYFKWKFSWDGWDGLYVGISERTPLHIATPILSRGMGLTNAFPRLNLEESKMEAHIGARTAVDAAAFTTTGNLTGFDDGGQLRRFRLYAKGDCLLLLPVSYELEVGYVPGGFYIEDSYLSFQNIKYIGEFKIGQFQPPMSLEAVTSSRDITFMESAAPVQALAPGVNAGFRIGRSVFNERATWALGMFSEGLGSDSGDASKNYGRVIGRLTWLPLYEAPDAKSPGEHLLHVGVSGNVLYSASGDVRYRSRPESHIAPIVIDTDNIDASQAAVVDFEAAWVRGPLSLQGEVLNSFVEQQNGSTAHFYGFYGYASWFLTGESRPYNRQTGTFGRLHPTKDFSFGGEGPGAWELAARASYTDLNDGNINGGKLALLTGGVTWYPHAHVRWKFNYIHGKVSDRNPSGKMNIFETRVEVDF